MKAGLVTSMVLACLLLISGCETMDSVVEGANAVKGATDRAVAAQPTRAGGVNLRSDEMLCSYTDNDPVTENSFKAAKILTPASSSTQNQAEALFADGDKMWTRHALATHKPSEAELRVGEMVLYMPHYSDDEEVSVEVYRDTRWVFGRITSTEALFKEMVEVNGEELYVKWIRVPDEGVE